MIREDTVVFPRPTGPDQAEKEQPKIYEIAKKISIIGGSAVVILTIWRYVND